MQAHSPFYISLSQSCRLVVFFSINHSLREKQAKEIVRDISHKEIGGVGLVKLGRCAWLVGLRAEEMMRWRGNRMDTSPRMYSHKELKENFWKALKENRRNILQKIEFGGWRLAVLING